MNHAELAEHTRGMTTERWINEVSPYMLPIEWLRPIQDRCDACAHEPSGGSADPIIHAYRDSEGVFWIEDGHHRYYDALGKGAAWILARVLRG